MTTRERSTLVTVVAWIFIVLAGFATLISLLQNIMIQTMFDGSQMDQALQARPADMPAISFFIASHMRLFFVLFLLMSAVTLAASVGLLLRRNWARLAFVAIMILAIVWNLGGLLVQAMMIPGMLDKFAEAPGPPDMQPFLYVMFGVTVLIAVGISVLFAWIAKRLLSPAVRGEFGVG